MTAIAAIADGDTVWMAADSLFAGDSVGELVESKIWINGGVLFGVSGYLRHLQVLRYELNVPKIDCDPMRYVVTKLVPAIRHAFEETGIAEEEPEKNKSFSGQILVGLEGRVFRISGFYGVTEPADGMLAIGSGSDFCLGALAASEHRSTEKHKRVREAVEAAIYFNPHCGGRVDERQLDRTPIEDVD